MHLCALIYLTHFSMEIGRPAFTGVINEGEKQGIYNNI